MNILDKIDKKIDEGTGMGTDFEDTVYRALTKVPDFKKLSSDKQDKISSTVAKMIKK